MPRRDDEVFPITDAPESAVRDRQRRTRRYLISMAVRIVCLIAAVFVEGPLRWVLVVGAVVIPYVAVVSANVITKSRATDRLPPLIVTDTRQLPANHPDRTHS